MRQIPTIQKLIGFLLLLVFTLSTTPKAFFHDLVTDHSDGPSCVLDHNTTVVHNQGFDCHFDDLVVSTPFVLHVEPSIGVLHNYLEEKPGAFYFSYVHHFFLHKENRGPPLS